MHSWRFIATKSRKKFQSSRFITSKSREKLQLSQFITNKSRKNVLAFFNHLNLMLAKFALMLFCQKLSRFIDSKSLENLQSSQFMARKSLKRVQSFWFIFSKTRKNVTIFSINSIYRQQTSFFRERDGENHLNLSRAKIQKKWNFGK